MRKLGIALLALAVVFGLSTGVMADDHWEEDVSVELEVQEFGDVHIEDDTLNLEHDETDIDSYTLAESNSLNVDIQANTSINVRVREDLSRALDEAGVDESAIEGLNFLADGQDEFIDNYGVGVEAFFDGQDGNISIWEEDGEKQGVENKYTYNDGTVDVTEDLQINSTWYGDYWYELEATEEDEPYKGTVEVIVEAN